MTTTEIYGSLARHLCELDGDPDSFEWEKSGWNIAPAIVRRAMAEISVHDFSDDDLRFLAGLTLVCGGRKKFWRNLAKIALRKNPKAIRRDLMERTDRDSRAVELFLKESGKTERDLYSAPEGGSSIAFRLVSGLCISPWCYLRHLNLASGVKQNGNEVKTNNILQEITTCRRTSTISSR